MSHSNEDTQEFKISDIEAENSKTGRFRKSFAWAVLLVVLCVFAFIIWAFVMAMRYPWK